MSVIDFFEPLTVVEKDEEGRDVVRVQHKTRKDAAAAAARRWLAENRAFSRVPEEELYSQPTFLAELVELVNLASAELIRPFRENNYPNANWGWGSMRTNHRSKPAKRSKRSSKTAIAFCDKRTPV